jgi:hypothetical protein
MKRYRHCDWLFRVCPINGSYTFACLQGDRDRDGGAARPLFAGLGARLDSHHTLSRHTVVTCEVHRGPVDIQMINSDNVFQWCVERGGGGSSGSG